MAVVNRNASIEFIVKPKQDLYLEGSLRKLPRVSKGEAYPCQMQKNQTFSCLFRHYAKHNGLCKDDLVFSFVDELQPEQTPETVHLMPQDEIWVEHRAAKEPVEKEDPVPAILPFAEQFRSVLLSGCHSDVKFIVGDEKVEIPAHRVILSARSEYFRAMLRTDHAMAESAEGVIHTPHEPSAIRRMLEFLYTNGVRDLATAPPSELIALMVLADEYLLSDLRQLCEKAATAIISMENVSRLLLLCARPGESKLREACLSFVDANRPLLVQDPNFRQDLEQNPDLGVLLFESSLRRRAISKDGSESPDWGSSSSGGPAGKRRRIAEQNSENELEGPPTHAGAAFATHGLPLTATAATTAPAHPPAPATALPLDATAVPAHITPAVGATMLQPPV